MPDEHSDPQKTNSAAEQGQDSINLSETLPRFSFKTGLTVYLSAGFLVCPA